MQKQKRFESAPQGDGKRTLSPAWKKAHGLRKSFCTLGAAAALVFGAGLEAPAQAQQPAPTYAQNTHSAPHKKAQGKYTGYAYSRARLNAMEMRMRLSPLGRELMQFANDQGLRIEMSNSKVMDDKPTDGFTVDGSYGNKRVRLNGAEKSDDELMVILVHELRHAWHDRVLHEGDMRLDPKLTLIKERMLEADVFAFQTHFAYEWEKATGKKLRLGNRTKPCDDAESSLCLLAGYAADRDAGMAVEKAYGKLIERTIEHVQAEQYDSDFVNDQKESWQSVIDDPDTGYDVFGDGMMTDAEFAATMRRVATVGLTPGATPSALADWSDADLTSLDKTGGATVKGFNTDIKKFDDARAAWNLYQQDSSDPEPSRNAPADPPPGGRVVRNDPPPQGPSV